VHVRIGLPQRYMLGAMQVVRDALHTVVERHAAAEPPEERGRLHRAIDRLLDLDQSLMLETYHRGREAEATQAFDEILRNTSDVVLTALPDGRVTQVNRDCPGVTRAELLRDGVPAIRAGLLPDSLDRFDDAWRRVVAGDAAALNIPLTHAGPDDRRYHFLLTLLPDVREAGRMRLVRGVVRDVTELRELEADLEERRRLAAVGEMVAGVAHEVRNPLQAVLLGVRRAAQGSDDKRVLSALQGAREGADQIERLVNDLLSFSKRLSLTLSTISAAALLESAVSSCAGHFEGREPPQWSVEGGESLRFRGDAFRMTQVLRNLVENAAEAAAGGAVAIHARPLGTTSVEIAVTDHGPGLPDEVRARLFEPFVTTKAGGTGLGLAIARRLVEAHGGRIQFESAAGGGTCVRLTLPVAGPATDR
jgi:signal transduction histidine kinase